MNQDKHLIIHFNNGTKMEVSFPTQIKNSTGALVEISKRLLDADKLVIQAEDRVLIIPWSSIKHLDVSGVPSAALPIESVKGARIVESAGSAA
jgi:hypothetical protein